MPLQQLNAELTSRDRTVCDKADWLRCSLRAAAELPAALNSSLRGGEALLPRHLPLSVRLERAFAARAADLPAATRVLLLVASADDRGVLAEIMKAAEVVAGVRPVVEDLDSAGGVRLVQADGPAVRFRYPLVRSAVYQAAAVAERHAAHAALAEVLAGDPGRRVWYRAATAVGPDATVAAELEEMVGRAVGAGTWQLRWRDMSVRIPMPRGGAYHPGRGHRPDADRRAVAPADGPGRVRRAL